MDEDSEKAESSKKRAGSPSIFPRSIKVIRTPSGRKENSENMEEVKDMLAHLMKDVKEIKADQKESKNEVKELREELKDLKSKLSESMKETHELKTANKLLLDKLKQIQEDNTQLRGNIEQIDRRMRKNKLVMSGASVNTSHIEEIKEIAEEVLRKDVGINPPIKAVTKINNNMISIEMESYEGKMEVLRNKHKLKNVKERKIYINEDMTAEERKVQSIIKAEANRERNKGNIVKTSYRKLIVNDMVWEWNLSEQKLVQKRSVSRYKQQNTKN